jgi:hypothetical protein
VFGSVLASAFFIKRNSMMFGYFQQLCFGHGTMKIWHFACGFGKQFFPAFLTLFM